MGLDGIELVMALEEAFGVELTDAEVERTVTPRKIGDLIFSKLQSTDQRICQSQRAFYLLRKTFMRQFGLPRANITPDMSFRSLIAPGLFDTSLTPAAAPLILNLCIVHTCC